MLSEYNAVLAELVVLFMHMNDFVACVVFVSSLRGCCLQDLGVGSRLLRLVQQQGVGVARSRFVVGEDSLRCVLYQDGDEPPWNLVLAIVTLSADLDVDCDLIPSTLSFSCTPSLF